MAQQRTLGTPGGSRSIKYQGCVRRGVAWLRDAILLAEFLESMQSVTSGQFDSDIPIRDKEVIDISTPRAPVILPPGKRGNPFDKRAQPGRLFQRQGQSPQKPLQFVSHLPQHFFLRGIGTMRWGRIMQKDNVLHLGKVCHHLEDDFQMGFIDKNHLRL